MREFYGMNQSSPAPISSPQAGQLVAVRAEEEEEILRAQICEMLNDKVKVRDRNVLKLQHNDGRRTIKM